VAELSEKQALSLRMKLELLRSELDQERVSFIPTWQEASDYILPRKSRFFISDTNKGDRRNQKILDNTGTVAVRTLRAGMMSGVTSPARPWFRLGLQNKETPEEGPVKQWLHKSAQTISNSFLRSNLYNILPMLYGDLGVYGTGCMFVEEDFTGDVMQFYHFPIGSYWISQNEKLKVDTFYREFRMTVRQVINKFARNPDGSINWDNLSESIKNYYNRNQLETFVDIAHVVMPNMDHDLKKLESKYKKFISIYYERGNTGPGDNRNVQFDRDFKYLSMKGYDFFPCLAPRWETTGEDVYATDSPGITAVGDIKQLQTGERRALQAIEKMINPPMTGPTSLRNQKVSQLPGDVTFVDTREGQGGFRPAHEVRFDINAMEAKQEQVRYRIQRAFFEDLFLMLAQSDRRQITAREIEERHEEKLLALGPVLEQLNQDLLDPLIDIAFDIHIRQGLLEDPPEEIQGEALKIEYISIMAQAQKLVGISGVDRFMGFASQLAQLDPNVLKKVDTEQAIDVYADMTSVPPSLVRPDDVVEAMKMQEQQQIQAAQQMEMAAQGAKAARDLSQAKTDEENLLNEITGGVAEGIGV
jgi:hypothetical protein